MTPELRSACERAVHVLTRDGRLLRAGEASLYILRALGYRSAAIGRAPPFLWAVEAGYGLVARHRGFFGRYLFRNEPEFEGDPPAA
jgi:predicted DCC family thiol-disulfide oxidoreductase YuxK